MIEVNSDVNESLFKSAIVQEFLSSQENSLEKLTAVLVYMLGHRERSLKEAYPPLVRVAYNDLYQRLHRPSPMKVHYYSPQSSGGEDSSSVPTLEDVTVASESNGDAEAQFPEFKSTYSVTEIGRVAGVNSGFSSRLLPAGYVGNYSTDQGYRAVNSKTSRSFNTQNNNKK